ncbi:MAG: peptide chain release factor N(5)-glutamine methyltransferase, partial [Treponema sp.]|nr:peptide chain release factor N(5)-glutamine methyltransferase [Treponema sp.]
MTIREARNWGRDVLVRSPTPALDADVLLSSVTGRDKTDLLFKADTPLSGAEEADYRAYIGARSTGLPVAYITGHKEFYGYDFLVTPDVLIPKPDTELLVEQALAVVREKLSIKKDRILTLCDMCTGSGCVGISIVRAAWEAGLVTRENALALTLCDISGAALE